MDAPTPTTVRATMPSVDWSEIGLADDDTLQTYIDASVERVSMVTGWTLATIPTNREILLTRAIGLTSIFMSQRENVDVLETAGDFDILSSFSAGVYSESRRDLAGKNSPLAVLCPWPPLAEALWDLMSPPSNDAVEAMYEYWAALVSGQVPPDFVVQEVDWAGTGLIDWYAPWQRGV